MKHKILIIVSLLTLLSACSQITQPTPTPLPPNYLPAVVALTGLGAFATADGLTPSAMPAEIAVSTELPIPSTEIPSPTPTFAAGFTDFAQIRFMTPGPASSVISPINLQ